MQRRWRRKKEEEEKRGKGKKNKKSVIFFGLTRDSGEAGKWLGVAQTVPQTLLLGTTSINFLQNGVGVIHGSQLI